jgi:hypothetical protein
MVVVVVIVVMVAAQSQPFAFSCQNLPILVTLHSITLR